jgi:dihydropteroate synthase
LSTKPATSASAPVDPLGHALLAERLAQIPAVLAEMIARGADIIRVHDVKEMVRVAKMTDAIVRAPITNH